MANISSINGNPIVPSNGSVGTAQVASGYTLMTTAEKTKLGGLPAAGSTPLNSINGNPIVVGTSGISNGAVTDEKLAQSGGVLSSVSGIEIALYGGGNRTSTFVQGQRTVANPDAIVSSTVRCTSNVTFVLYGGETVSVSGVSSGLRYGVAGGMDGAGVYDSGWLTSDSSIYIQNRGTYFVNVSKTSGEAILPSEISITVTAERSREDSVMSKMPQVDDAITNQANTEAILLGGAISAPLEIGAINFTRGTSWQYLDTRHDMVRTRKGYDLYLPKGTTVKLTDYTDARFYVGERSKDGTGIDYWGWLTSDFTVPENGCYGILISNLTPVAQESVDDLGSLLSITYSGIINEDSGGLYVPTYFEEHLETQIPKINDNINAVGKNGETFLFITDLHWETNYQNSPALVKRVLDRTNTRVLLCGGDLINTAEKAVAEDLTMRCLKAFDFPGYVMPVAFGNHDANSLNWQSTELREQNRFDENTVFGLTQKNTSYGNRYISEHSVDFYFDRADTNTRFVVIDSGEGGSFASETIPNLCGLLIDTPSGYHVIIVQHWIVTGTTPENSYLSASAVKVCNVIKAFNDKTSVSVDGVAYDFTNASGSIELYIGGHTHFDFSYDADSADNPSGVPIVLTNCDSYRNNTITRWTKDEQCFDVVTVDYANKTVECVRIGRGNDRTFSY